MLLRTASTYDPRSYSILSVNFKSPPYGPRHSITTPCNLSLKYDLQSVCSLGTTQSGHTAHTDVSNPAEDSTTNTMGHTYQPIFPPVFYDETTHLKMDPTRRLPFAHYPPSHFMQDEWDEIWSQPEIVLDPYLTNMVYLRATPSLPTAFHHEQEFVGYAYCVKVDADWVNITADWMKKISFICGTSVNISKINTPTGQYTAS